MNPADYKTLTQREHVLARPAMYLAATAVETRVATVYTGAGDIVSREITSSPALERMFLEALQNSTDCIIATRARRECKDLDSARKAPISVTIDADTGLITVRNAGDSIPIEGSPVIPETVFGQLLSSSNFSEGKDRIGAGTHGIGVKAVNIFAHRFTATVGDSTRKLRWTGIWEDNMARLVSSKVEKRAFCGPDFVEISYIADFPRFSGAEGGYTSDVVDLFRKGCLDASFTTHVAVSFNGMILDARTAKAMAKVYFPTSDGGPPPLVWTSADGQNSLIVADAPEGDGSVYGFVNGLEVPEGTHVRAAFNRIAAGVSAALAGNTSLAKAGFTPGSVTAATVRPHFRVIASVHVANPVFTGQNKQLLSAPKVSAFDAIGASFFKTVGNGKWEITSAIRDTLDAKKRRAESKTDAGRRKKRVSVETGEDANLAGTSDSLECVLYLTEGESASAHIKQRIDLLPGRKDRNGLFPCKGKTLNVSGASTADEAANKELAAIKKLIGLSSGVDYTDDAVARAKLRYGRVVIAADRDEDGSHVTCLLVNMLSRWPSLFAAGRVACLITPLIRVVNPTSGRCVRRFFAQSDFNSWAAANGDAVLGSNVKYLKGLASSSTADIREDLAYAPLVVLTYDDAASENLSLAFNPKRASDRKAWILGWKNSIGSTADPDLVSVVAAVAALERRTALVSAAREPPAPMPRTVSGLINSDLASYSAESLFRAIPGVFDGMKRAQRQALYFALSHFAYGTSGKPAMQIHRMASAAAEKVLYQHGESSLCGTIVNLCFDFVGSGNNLTLFAQKSQLGTRHGGGHDAGAPRYVSTMLSDLVPALFSREDVDLVTRRRVEGEDVEPEWLPCNVPLAVINASRGMATGFATYVPPHDPVETVDWLLRRLSSGDGGAPPRVHFVGFMGEIVEDAASGSVVTTGTWTVSADAGSGGKTRRDIEITELPVGTWTGAYRKFLEKLLDDGEIEDLADLSSVSRAHFRIRGASAKIAANPAESLHLTTRFSTRNMTLIDDAGFPTVYASVADILDAYVNRMLTHLSAVCAARVSKGRADLAACEEKSRLISDVVSGRINLKTADDVTVAARLAEINVRDSVFDALRISECTRARVSALTSRAADLRKQIAAAEADTPTGVWTRRLSAARGAIVSHLASRAAAEAGDGVDGDGAPPPKAKRVRAARK